jgi:hypothetical protein
MPADAVSARRQNVVAAARNQQASWSVMGACLKISNRPRVSGSGRRVLSRWPTTAGRAPAPEGGRMGRDDTA